MAMAVPVLHRFVPFLHSRSRGAGPCRFGGRDWAAAIHKQRDVVVSCAPSSPSPQEEASKNNQSRALLPPEDARYIAKLIAGCVGGAILIKYGSLIVPDIARPSILQALAMIFTPVVVSVAALWNASSRKKP
ncbi:uncharacterized protein LOC112346386 [Selaginella moellendorffii]|uniref:uncharacterized protein LOC112346386 n=1 Tax=Selaginella moellendorffii TaxID=88036 RepID=UPI000D1C5CA8|nr:uncharacterized protein LOC112346386 [Selaginella moellendorffii]|eukprot:XP_024531030.1 uncharacterized protein LOC112346386 [Selaginella moellendorffii]